MRDPAGESGAAWPRPVRGANDLSRTRQTPRKPIIGLAGGIGAGKSLAARILQTLGAAVIDFDQLSHEQLRDPEVVDTLRRWWGRSVLTAAGQVDRTAVAEIVFDDPAALVQLEKLLYPGIGRRRQELMAAYAVDSAVKAIVLDAPKLFEAGLSELCDDIVFVEAEFAVRVQRVRESRGWTEAELIRREKLLNPLDIKKANTDYVVVNHFSIEDLQAQLERVFSSVLASVA